ncbi:MAG: hypothetical protein FWH55_07440 [Oscillospiraceae bacterium]|nr:hypothetical protein [Oscillospiraceae bacterium]
MDEFERFAKKASDVFYGMVRKSGEFVENTKVTYNINLEKDKIIKLQNKIGAKIYKIYKDGGEYPEAFAEDLKAMSEIEDNIKTMEKNLNEKRAYTICPECSSKLGPNNVYCPTCGTKQGPTSTDQSTNE